MVAECFMGSVSLNDELVKRGWAVAYREYSKTHVEPRRRLGGQGGYGPSPSRCRLNGDRNVVVNATPRRPRPPAEVRMVAHQGQHQPSGQKIYHQPGDRDYSSTRIDTRKGERWFCTEREAQDNGWKHTGNNDRRSNIMRALLGWSA